MFEKLRTAPAYRPVAKDEVDDVETERRPRRIAARVVLAAACPLAIVLLCFALLFSSKDSCSHPHIRREWRTLSEAQQLDYLRAVLCLKSTSSGLNLNASLYDDFPWVHRNIGYVAHDAALFLPWHRYFVHIYETALRQSCQYTGPMPYWDWTLDWLDMSRSPLFDDTVGFGGNGNEENDHCVQTGPFAGFEALYRRTRYDPHCLQRDFAFNQDVGSRHYENSYLSPNTTRAVLETDDYMELVLGMEYGPHNHLPLGVGGDFLSFTAPADPLFFMHHSQLDRLWWIWQNRKARNGHAYYGPKERKSNVSAGLHDVIAVEFPGLAGDVRVEDVFKTDGGLLCYTYDTARIDD